MLIHRSYPTTVSVEVIYNDSLKLPAITVCNQNSMRLVRFSFTEQYNNVVFTSLLFACPYIHKRNNKRTYLSWISKAFDKVGHQRLLRKLEFYGIKGTTNRWIASFLLDRKQSVVVEGEKLEYVEVLDLWCAARLGTRPSPLPLLY